MTEDEVDFSKLSLEDRCVHKAWKARLSAFEELIKLFGKIDDERSPEWNKFTGFVRKFPTDSNAAAQEKGLEATLIFMENSAQASRIVGEVMSGVISKCLTAPKARSKELAAEITMMCIEIEKYEIVLDELMKGVDAKNPKVVAACISLITNALREFGPKVINLKILVKKIAPLSEDRDKFIREENKKLTVELYRWIGAGFKPQLASLKPVVMAELELEFDKIGNEKPIQMRFLRSQQAKKEKMVEAAGGSEGEIVIEENAGIEIDPYDLLEPVDILSKLPKDFYEKCEAKKWQDRKEALGILEGLASNPKLEPGDYSELVRVLKRMIAKDTNVLVVALAGKCVSGLAAGLKKKFAPYAPSCIGTVLEKFKEKKPAVLTAMREASDACFAATTLEQIQEDAVEALGNKNPAVKAETSLLLARSFAKTPLKTLNDKKLMKLYFTALLANLNESDPAVRDASAEALGVALKAVGEKPLQPYLGDLEPIKLQKVKEFAEKAVIVVQKTIPSVAKPAPKATSTSAKSNEIGSSNSVASKVGAIVVKRKTPAGNTGTFVKRPASTAIAVDPYSEDHDQGPSSRTSPVPLDDHVSRVDISGEITEALIEKLGDKNWKLRDETLDKISGILARVKNVLPNLGELPTALGARLQDSNRNIAANAFLVCQNLAIALGPHCKTHLRVLLPNMLAGLSDGKTNVRSTVVACLNAWAENAGVEDFFQGEFIADALKGNSPNVRIEVFNWLNIHLPTLKNFNKEDLNACVPLLYACLEDRTVDVRKSAQDVVLSFMIHLGYENMTRAAGRLKPVSKTVVQGILDKCKPNLPVKLPTTTQTAKALQTSKSSLAGTATYKVDKSVNKAYDSGVNSRNETPESSSSQVSKAKVGKGLTKPKVSPNGKKCIDEQVGVNLPRNNLKQQRINDENKLKILRWQFTSPRDEFVDLLKELMTTAGISKNLISLMFHTDFKMHLRALDILSEELMVCTDTTQCNYDLILKWLSIRFFDTNPTVLIRSLDYIAQTLRALSDQAYVLGDLEATSFVPYLLNKIGDPKDNIRSSVHSIFRQLHIVSHPNRIFTFVMDGLKSKNARQRAECLDELSYMISTFHLGVCQPNAATALKDIAKQISDRDNGVRNSALNCIVETYFLTGEKVFKMIGQLADKDQSLLDERIKRAAKTREVGTHLNAPRLSNPPLYPLPTSNSTPSAATMTPNGSSPPGSAVPKADSSPGGFGMNTFTHAPRNDIRLLNETVCLSDLPPEDQGEEMYDLYNEHPTPRAKKWTCPPEYRVDFEALDNMFGAKDLEPMPPLQLFDTDIEYLKHEAPLTLPKRSVVLQVQAGSPNPVVPQRACQSIDLVVSQVGNSDIRKVMEAIVQVEALIGDTTVASVMVTRADHLMLMVTTQMRRLQPLLQSQRTSNVQETNQVYRCIVHLLQTFYKGTLLPLQVSKDILRDLIYHLLVLIVDPCITILPDSSSIVRHINVLVVRIIEKSDANATISALIRLLNEALRMNSQPRLLDLTMKCQWKLLKQFGVWIKEKNYVFDIKSFIQEFNTFFTSHPLNSFNSGNETPLKTIKTIFHALVMHLGHQNFSLTMAGMPELKDTEAEKYINKLIMREMSRRVSDESLENTLVADNAFSNNSNNNIQGFFSSLPDPNEAKMGNERAGVYLKRLAMIQKRSGLDTGASSLSDE